MVKGRKIREMNTIVRSEVNYREISALNYSMLKLFDEDPIKFYEQFKLGKLRPDKKSLALQIGDLVDFYLMDCYGNEQTFNKRFEEKFHLYEDVKGSGQVYILADRLFSITKKYIVDGVVTVSFDTRFKEAVAEVKALNKYSGKTEQQILEDFNNKGLEYFSVLMDNITKDTVDLTTINKAMKVGNIIKNDEFTKDLFSVEDNVEIFNKFPIEWEYTTEYGKVKCKSEVDILIVDHNKKIIYLKDLKTTFDNEEFKSSYIKNKYYLQAGFYYLAVNYWKEKEGLGDYKVTPMEFIVGDTSVNNRRPIRYVTDNKDLECCLNGFKLKGVSYKGVIELMNDIMWAEKNDIWDYSRGIYLKKGITNLDFNYER